MIKVSVLYPNTSGSRFDTSYYFTKHIPLVQEKLGSALKGLSVEAFQQSFGPHAEAVVGDIPNYTDTQPTIQISDVKL